MDLTILGCYGPYPSMHGACSGYLVRHRNESIILDLGNGTLRNLLRQNLADEPGTLILSHWHADHCADMLVYRYYLDVKQRFVDVYAPQDPQDMLALLAEKEAYRFHKIDQNETVRVNDFLISFCQMGHAITSFAVKVECEGRTLVYSGDTKLTQHLVDFAHGCDVFLCEAAVSDSDVEKKQFHMSAAQACQVALEAECGHLILTHFYPQYAMQMYQQEIQPYKDRIKISFARENNIYSI